MISEKQIETALIKYTCEHSKFDVQRPYIGLSKIVESAEDIVAQINNGRNINIPGLLKCYKGYQMERDIIERLRAIYGDKITTGMTYTGYNELVAGHPDCEIDGYPADIKSVAKEEFLPDGKFSSRVFWQMQGYMLFAEKNKSYLIYEARDTGAIRVYVVEANRTVQAQIKEKIEKIILLLRRQNAKNN